MKQQVNLIAPKNFYTCLAKKKWRWVLSL